MRGFILLCSWLFLTASAAAQVSDDERARTHFEAGRSYYEQARYDDAAREFDQAFTLSGRAALLLNLSQAHERGLHFAEAIADIDRYLALVPDTPDRLTLEKRKEQLEELRARMDAQAATAAPAPTPAPAPAPTSAPAPSPAATTSPSQPADNPWIVPGWILIGTGGAALAASLVTGLMASAKASDLDDQCPNGACPASAQSDIDSGKSLAIVSTVLLAVGVVAGGVGVGMLVLGGDSADEQARAAKPGRLTAMITPLGASARLAF